MAKFLFKDKNIYYTDTGEGKPIILLNGIMMSTASWKIFEPELLKNNRLILVDMLDQGQSDKMTEDFDIRLQAEVIKALCDELKLTKANIVGASYGGEVAQHFAANYPEYVEKLVLFNTVARTNKTMQEISQAWNLAVVSPEAYYYTTIPTIYSTKFFEENYEWMEARKKLLTATAFANKDFLDSMVRLTKSANHHDTIDILHKITAPTLVVGAEDDLLTPLVEQKLIHQHIKGSELVIVPGCGHALPYEKPMMFVSLILGFVNLDQTAYTL